MTQFDVFASIRVAAMRVGDECMCVELAHKASLSMTRTWQEHLRSFDWFLTHYGRKLALTDE